MIRDYWVYQERQSETAQWALYVVKEFAPGKPETVTLDFTVYSEDIGNASKSVSFVGWHYPNVSGYVDSLIDELLEFTSIYSQDKRQLETAIANILFD